MVYVGDNARKHIRLTANIPCEIITSLGYDMRGDKGRIVDYALGGLGLVTTIHLNPGREIFLTIKFQNRDLQLSGNVVRETQVMGDVSVYGIRYTRLGFFQKFSVRRKLAALAKSTAKK